MVWRKIKSSKNKLFEYFFPSPEELEAHEDEEYNYYWLAEVVFAGLEDYQGECKPAS